MRRLLLPLVVVPAAGLMVSITLMAILLGMLGFTADRLSAKRH